uniref:Reverse transcriptase domain-containing protein n=1 Tax=Tanacetum cinerariifolium TaxID=118510 RepID=A0A6L2JQ58_TANCI|nr:hypothetical protein [Tanacetum cinerariifolium]
MADQRTMAELLHAPTEGYAEAIVVLPILADQFELKCSLINMISTDQFFGLEKDNPHDHIRWFNKITSTIKYKDVPNSAIKLMLFLFSLAGAGRRWLEKEPQRSIHTWEDLVSKFINEFSPPQEQQISIMKSPIFNNEIAKLTHAVNQQTSVVTTAMTAILKQFQATPTPSPVKVVEEICVTCSGAHPHYQCLATGGNTFLELQDNIQGYVSAAAINYNQGNSVYRPPASLSDQTNEIKNMMASLLQMNTASTLRSVYLPSNTVANPKGELKSITTQSGIVLDGPIVPIPPTITNPKEDERVEDTLTDPNLAEYTIKVPPPHLHVNITLADALIPMPKYQKMLKALLSNKEKLQELANTPLDESCSAVILKKLPEKLGDPGKIFIPCGFSELKCKALANLGASINLMPLFVWKKLGLPGLISTRMTLELATRAICTPAGIARDVFVSVGQITFPANFVIVDYESDPRVPLILGRPFLRTARALIDVHGEEMILQSINLINVFNNSSEDFFEDLFSTNQPSGNPTFSYHPELTSPEVNIFDLEGGNVLPEKLLDLNSTKDLYPPLHVNPLSGSTTYSYSSNSLLEEFADELALITFPLKYDDDLQFDVEFDLKEIEFLLYQDIDSSLKDSIDQSNLANHADNFVDSMPKMFADEHAPDYSSPPIYDEYDDDFLEVESDTKNVYDDPFDFKGEKIKESKLLIDELELPCNFLPPSEYDSFIS